MKILSFYIGIFITLSVSTIVLSAELKSQGKSHLKVDKTHQTIQVLVDPGFHINTKAPTILMNGAQTLPPQTLTEQRLVFRWREALAENARIKYYLCDDAKTVCEPHEDFLTPTGVKPSSPLKSAIPNTLEEAFSQAKKKNQLVLIDFTASWCPACIRLIHESFPTKIFQKAIENWIFVQIDVDRNENKFYLEKYSIHSFPTLVITDAHGNELDRILDFLPPEVLAQKLIQITKNRPRSLVDLQKKALAGDPAAAQKLGENAYRAQKHADCIQWFEKAKVQSVEYYQCLIAQAEDNESSAVTRKAQTLIPLFEKAIQAFPQSYYSLDWRLRKAKGLLEANTISTDNKGIALKTENTTNLKNKDSTDEIFKFLEEFQILLLDWIDHPKRISDALRQGELGELTDLAQPELKATLAEVYELQHKPDQALKSYQQAVESTLKLKPTVKNPTIIIYLVHYLKKCQRTTEALAWLEKLESAYPQEFTYSQRKASLLKELNEPAKALIAAERAFEHSYGTNQLKVGLLLAKIRQDLRQFEAAQKGLTELLALPAAQLKSNEKHVLLLRKTLSELDSSKPTQ